jgi:hypothetical protein
VVVVVVVVVVASLHRWSSHVVAHEARCVLQRLSQTAKY